MKISQVKVFIFDSIGHEARSEIFWYIEAYYNRKRKHSTLGYLSPVNFELVTLKKVA